jgi:hypothetical protein
MLGYRLFIMQYSLLGRIHWPFPLDILLILQAACCLSLSIWLTFLMIIHRRVLRSSLRKLLLLVLLLHVVSLHHVMVHGHAL